MKLVAKVKLLPSHSQANALTGTLETANAACDYVSGQAWEAQTFGQFALHRMVYYDVRSRFGLSAQVVVRLISKVVDSYKIDRAAKRTFRPHGGITYDSRILSWKMEKSQVNIWTVEGRLSVPFVCGPRQRELLQGQRGESDLCLIDGQFYLFATCDWDEPTPGDVSDFLGVDLGIVNIAADSDGNTYAGAQLNGLRHRHARLRRKLQAKGSKGARRLLARRRRRESRFAHHVNHCIAKALVLRARDTARGIALEDLKGIRQRVTVRRAQRRQHHSWAFADLRAKVEYKARLYGVPFVLVNPRHTSQTCPSCGTIDRANRVSQALFSCASCGFSGPADTTAAGNIARRAVVNRPHCSPAPVGVG